MRIRTIVYMGAMQSLVFDQHTGNIFYEKIGKRFEWYQENWLEFDLQKGHSFRIRRATRAEKRIIMEQQKRNRAGRSK